MLLHHLNILLWHLLIDCDLLVISMGIMLQNSIYLLWLLKFLVIQVHRFDCQIFHCCRHFGTFYIHFLRICQVVEGWNLDSFGDSLFWPCRCPWVKLSLSISLPILDTHGHQLNYCSQTSPETIHEHMIFPL